MADTASLTLRIDLGPLASMESLSATIEDLALTCEAGSALQRRASRAELTRRTIRDIGPRILDDEDFWFFDYPSRRWPMAALVAMQHSDWTLNDEFSRRLASNMREYGTDDEVRVRELRYDNPLEAVVILAAGGVVLALLRLVRNWSADRRTRNALADDVQDTMQARKELRRRLLDQIANGELRVPDEWLDEVLKPTVVEAIERLSRHDFQLPQADDHEQ